MLWFDKPIGNNDNGYIAAFDGNDHVIFNLLIQRPGEDYVGLSGLLIGSSRLERVRLHDVNVVGNWDVGSLVGQAGRREATRTAIISSYATGTIRGVKNFGGLVGENYGEIAASYAAGAVSGTWRSGGLVGVNHRKIVASYATGVVSGSWWGIGGLMGWNNGRPAADSYWDTRTSGRSWGGFGTGKTTIELQTPTTYTGIYYGEGGEGRMAKEEWRRKNGEGRMAKEEWPRAG